jgi:hypothetical protein
VDFRWSIRVEWPGRADWSAREGAARLVESVRRVGTAFPGLVDGFTVQEDPEQWTVDSPGVVDRVAGALTGQATAGPQARFDDVHALLAPVGPDRMTIGCDQTGPDPVHGRGQLIVDFYRPSAEYLTAYPDRVAQLVAELCGGWQARNGWVDFVHVRRDWNEWREGLPVYGWATWLHPRFATVDPGGLDVTATATGDGGQLLVVNVEPAAMADRDGDAGRDVIGALVDRTVLADGRRLVEANPEAANAGRPT